MKKKIWLTSDTHFGHDREFIWSPRGFKNVWTQDSTIIENWNSVVGPDDEVYHLGDVMLGSDLTYGLKCLKDLKGHIHIIRGNHDSLVRIAAYKNCWNVEEVCDAKYLKYKKFNFFLCHYPTLTTNLEKSPSLKEHLLCLYGHTHQKEKFYNDIPYMYNVGVDAHNCTPILIDDIIEDMKQKVQECMSYL